MCFNSQQDIETIVDIISSRHGKRPWACGASVAKAMAVLAFSGLLGACGGGGSAPSSGQGNSVGTPTTPPTQPPTQPPVSSGPPVVNFDAVQLAGGQPYQASRVQSQNLVNGTGAFRLPLADQQLTGNLTISVDASDPDGISSVWVGFSGNAEALQLCAEQCGTTFHKTITGFNPLDVSIISGPQALSLWIQDNLGNQTELDRVAFDWQATQISGITAGRQNNAIDMSWTPLGNYLRYNVYVASEPGVTKDNYQQLADGQAFLALREPTLNLSGKEDAKTFYTTVTGIDGSGESAFGVPLEVAALEGVIDLPPTAVNDAFITDEDTSLSGNLLGNDSDEESQVLTVSLAPVIAPTNGAVSINENGDFTYTPNADFNGKDAFSYQVSDGIGQTDAAVVNITVNQANDPPEPSPNNFNVLLAVGAKQSFTIAQQDGVLDVAAPGLLINDFDIDGGNLTVITPALVEPTQGTLELRADGSFTYTLNPGASGEDSFTYQTIDSSGSIAEGLVRITINGESFPPIAANDQYAMLQDGTLSADNSGSSTMSLLNNDIDLDEGDVLTVTEIVRPAQQGTANVAADGTFTYIPAANYYGIDTFIYKVVDLQGNEAQAAAIIFIERRNSAPIATNDSYEVSEDNILNVIAPRGLLSNDSDPELDPITVNVTPTQAPVNGELLIAADGGFSYQPNENFAGADSFGYQISDDSGLTSQATVSLTVNAINDPPVANDDFAQTGLNTNIDVDVLANDTDADNDPLTILAAQTTAGNVTIIQNRSMLKFIPTGQFEGTALVEYTVSDGKASTVGQLSVLVTNSNEPPVANDDSYTLQEDQPLIVATINGLLANDIDPEGEAMTVTVTPVTDVNNGTLVLNGDGSFRYIPNSQFSGTDSFVYQVLDSFGAPDSATVTLTVNAVNDAPIAVDDNVVSAEDTLINLNVLANDSDPENDPLTVVVAVADNGSVTIEADNTLNYTPDANFFGNDEIRYQISDGNQGFASAVVNLTIENINDAPTVVDDLISTAQGTPVIIDVLANDSDVDGDTLEVITATAGNGGITFNADRTLTYAPNGGFSGEDLITYIVSDNNGGSASGSVRVTVIPDNAAPIAQDDQFNVNEDTLTSLDVLANDSDPEGAALTLQSVTAVIGTATIVNNQVDYQPSAEFSGTDTLTYTVTDQLGASASATVTVTVLAVNDPPIAAADSGSVAEGGSVTLDVLANDSDIDSTTLSLVSASAANGTASVTPEQLLLYVASSNFVGVETVTYQVSDEHGGVSSGTVSITITPTADAPVAVADTATVAEDTQAQINVLANDSDPDGDSLTVTAATSENATVTINADQTLTYLPKENFNGTDTVNYTISDTTGLTASSQLVVTVTPVNDAPVAVNDSDSTHEDTPIELKVLENDTDIDGDTLTITAAAANNGTVVINQGSTLTYTPNQDFIGDDVITYTISDGNGGSAGAQVAMVVATSNDEPIAVADSATTDEDTPVTINVLANDTDIDSPTLTVTEATAENGTVVINEDSTLLYTPKANFNGSDTINYAITDNQGGKAASTVAVTITPVNDVPVAEPDTATTDEDVSVTVNVLQNDSDIDNDTLTVTVEQLQQGGASVNADQSVSYFPPKDFSGEVVINYTINDGNGGSASSTLTVTVNAVNDGPTALDDVAVTNEDQTLAIDVLANDSDPENDNLTVTASNPQ